MFNLTLLISRVLTTACMLGLVCGWGLCGTGAALAIVGFGIVMPHMGHNDRISIKIIPFISISECLYGP